MTDDTHHEPTTTEPDSAASVVHHDDHTHMDAHATLSDDGHAETRVGPIDWGAWLYALIGAAAGGIVLVVFWLALN